MKHIVNNQGFISQQNSDDNHEFRMIIDGPVTFSNNITVLGNISGSNVLSHNFNWGTFLSESFLPNVSGSSTQTSDLIAGDIAWVSAHGGMRYECFSTTQNSASWKPVSPVNGTAVITLYVGSSGSDTTGDGSFSNPFATIARASQEICKFSIPRVHSLDYGVRIAVIPPYSNVIGSNTAITFQPTAGAFNGSSTFNGILIDAFCDPSLMATVDDPRFTVIQGPITASAVTTENGRPKYTFSVGTFSVTDADVGRHVRVFNSSGTELYRGAVAYQRANVSGVDELVVATYAQETPALTDQIYIVKPAVSITGNTSLNGLLSTRLNLICLEFTGQLTINANGYIGSAGCQFGNTLFLGCSQYSSRFEMIGNIGSRYSAWNHSITEFNLTSDFSWFSTCKPSSFTSTAISAQNTPFPSYIRIAGVVKGKIVSAGKNSTLYCIDAPYLRGGVAVYGGSYLSSLGTNTALAPIIGNAITGVFSDGGIVEPGGAIIFDASTITGDAIQLKNCSISSFITGSLKLNAMTGSATTLSSGQALNVIEFASIPINPTSTLRGSGSLDVKVGSLSAISYTTLTLSSSVVDTGSLSRVRIQ